jgi:hypothetical protein
VRQFTTKDIKQELYQVLFSDFRGQIWYFSPYGRADVCKTFTAQELFTQSIEPVPKPYGFSTGSWKKRSNRTKVRPAFSLKSKGTVPKLKFWNSLNLISESKTYIFGIFDEE